MRKIIFSLALVVGMTQVEAKTYCWNQNDATVCGSESEYRDYQTGKAIRAMIPEEAKRKFQKEFSGALFNAFGNAIAGKYDEPRTQRTQRPQYQADGSEEGTVITENTKVVDVPVNDPLNMRAWPSGKSRIVSKLERGTFVTVIRSKMNGNTKWSKVWIEGEGEGWVAAKYLR